MLDVLLLLSALFFAPPMLYGIYAGHQRARGVDVPELRDVMRDAWAMAGPWLRLVAWAARWVLAPARARELMSSDTGNVAADRADRPQTDLVSALADAAETKSLDRTRIALIELLVSLEWQAGGVRGLLKGDNGTIGQEVEAARQRLGIKVPPRVVTVGQERREVKI